MVATGVLPSRPCLPQAGHTGHPVHNRFHAWSRPPNCWGPACRRQVCERRFRRYIDRYEEAGLEGLRDKRSSEVSSRKAPVAEVLRLEALYQERYDGWSVKHFFERYQDEHRGGRSYTWVKSRLQERGLTPRNKRRGKPRRRRPRAPLAGMMIHQDGSTHEWVPGQVWDLSVALDDANSEMYSAFFVEEEGTLLSFRGVRETLFKKGLFSRFYSDRGSHYWRPTEAGDKVDKHRLTQFGRAMNQLGIQMIAAYSPEARDGTRQRLRAVDGRRYRQHLVPSGRASSQQRPLSKLSGCDASVTSGAALPTPGSKESPCARIPGCEPGALPRAAVSGTVHG